MLVNRQLIGQHFDEYNAKHFKSELDAINSEFESQKQQLQMQFQQQIKMSVPPPQMLNQIQNFPQQQQQQQNLQNAPQAGFVNVNMVCT